MDQRSYNQYCAIARTLDLVGERWTLLLVRELLTGPKRFGDLQKSLRGMGTGLLAARLKHLEREGLTQKVTLPPPARTPAYALTEAGQELGPVVLGLSRWGMKWALGERREAEVFQPGWALLAMQASFDPQAAAGVRAVFEFRIDEEVFHVRVEDGEIETALGPAQRPDAVIETSGDRFARLAEGRWRLTDGLKDGSATATGDRQVVRLLGKLFRLPRPAAR
ncbi:winged helix-turn-helix transcriptional regulator [Amycolatopsis magusensis]|uniref:DNA-binding HxlR family transcriptional regulator/putative sterol carrier protein n=1 Tax=Amycolatopsis magusensis TaxID=882444 RepID=A0ABS4Q475_9PSEU|nr:winged helix-turn-helix transcriptional regulator [Amycolatopsis magusensis]MBP2185606.1 DNA-binding HxlR family transcriptional regulator/putative sterol carrier protein [Amycolatopsis magusensis]MDI5980697.1 winged helix-turn-helix transcriptional regulator [Amycolatopsis magusensis]